MNFIRRYYIKCHSVKRYVASILIVSSLCVGLTLSYILKQNTNTTYAGLCDISNHPCELLIDAQILTVNFVRHPQVEEKLQLTISSNVPFKLDSSTIKGANMYMGTIPVVAEKVSNSGWRGWTYLGACAEPNMIWELEITLNTEEGIKKGYLKFETSLN